MVRQFLGALIPNWVVIVTGVLSLVFAAVAFMLSQLAAGLFWLAAYFCLFIAFYQVWITQKKSHDEAIATLSARIEAQAGQVIPDHFLREWNRHTPTEHEVAKFLLDFGQVRDSPIKRHLENVGMKWQASDLPNIASHDNPSGIISMNPSPGLFWVNSELKPLVRAMTAQSN